MNQNEKSRSLLPDVKRMNCGILGLSPDHTGPLVYYSDAALAIKAALTSREPAYDRELIARMLTEYNDGHIGQFSPVAVEHQIKLLREAENRDAEGVRTVRRGDMTSLPADVARCPGVEYDGHFREGCETCLRRTDRSHFPQQVWMAPPAIIVFFCEALIEPGDQT